MFARLSLGGNISFLISNSILFLAWYIHLPIRISLDMNAKLHFAFIFGKDFLVFDFHLFVFAIYLLVFGFELLAFCSYGVAPASGGFDIDTFQSTPL